MNPDQLSNFTIGDKFNKNGIKQIKQNLQIYHGSKLSLTSNKNLNKIFIKCKQIPCPFQMEFVLDDQNYDHQNNYYVYCKNKENHTCDSDETMKKFFQRRKYLISLTSNIRQIMAENMLNEKKSYTPLELLSELAFRINQSEDFLYEGLTDYHMKRKLKKKFDNIVNDLKKATEEEIIGYKKINGDIDNSDQDEELSKPKQQYLKFQTIRQKNTKKNKKMKKKIVQMVKDEQIYSKEKLVYSNFQNVQSENIFSSQNRNTKNQMSLESDFGENDLFPNYDHNFDEDD